MFNGYTMPPAHSDSGAIHERIFRVVRKILLSITDNNVLLTCHQMRTVVCEAMHILSSRLLVPLNASAQVSGTLSPAQIAGGCADASLPTHEFIKANRFRNL